MSYNPHTRGHGKPYQSEQVKRMEAMSKAHHPTHHKATRPVNPMEERTESAAERKMEKISGEE